MWSMPAWQQTEQPRESILGTRHNGLREMPEACRNGCSQPTSNAAHAPPCPSFRHPPTYTFASTQDSLSRSRQWLDPPTTSSHCLTIRQGSSPNDVSYHPYRHVTSPASRPPSAKPLTRPLLFVDATQEASGAVGAQQQCRPKRKRIMQDQLVKLTCLFETTDAPSYDVREKLGKEIGMTNREVQVWFQNRRAKVNRQRQAVLAKEQAAQAAASENTAQPRVPPLQTASAQQHQWLYRECSEQRNPPQRIVPSPPPRLPPHQLQHSSPTGYGPSAYPSHPHSPLQAPVSSPTQLYRPSPCNLDSHASAPLVVTAPSPHSAWPAQFPLISPPLTVSTPGLSSPGSVTSSYFSRSEGPTTPGFCGSSPQGDPFFRLTLDSPQLLPRSSSVCSERAPSLPKIAIQEAPVQLAPFRNLLNPAPASCRPAHRRSISDPLLHPTYLPAPEPLAPGRVPFMRGILHEQDSMPSTSHTFAISAPTCLTQPPRASPPLPPSGASAPLASPPVGQLVPTLTRSSSPFYACQPPRPRLVSCYSTVDMHAGTTTERISGKEGCDPAHSRGDHGCETILTGEKVDPAGLPPRQSPLGLGMLIAAATQLSASDMETRRALQVHAAG
ncbi:hypothetical protein JCM11641_007961 [Rhodosporidiobolus odoratus]